MAMNSIMRIYDLRTGQLRWEMGTLTRTYFSANGTRLMTTNEENTNSTIWNIEGENPLPLMTIHVPVWAATLSADGHWFAFVTAATEPPNFDENSLELRTFSSFPFTLEVWDVDKAVQFSQQTINLSKKPILNFSPDNQLLTITDDDGIQICHITLDVQGCPGVYLNSLDTHLFASDIVISPDSQTFAASIYGLGRDGTIYRHLYVQPVADQFYILNGYNDPTIGGKTAHFSPDNTLLLAGESGGFSPDGQLIATGEWALQLWDVDALLTGDSPTGSLSDSLSIPADDAGSLRLWDIDDLQTGSAVSLVNVEHQNVHGLAFNADGTILFVYKERQVTMWGIPIE